MIDYPFLAWTRGYIIFLMKFCIYMIIWSIYDHMILSWGNEVIIKNNWFFVHVTLKLGVSKKTEKLRKLEKNNWKNQTIKKKPIKILKKLTGSVRFYKPKTEKKLEKNWDKPEKNRIKLKKPNQTKKNASSY
jgi:hypothetical protein